MKVAHPIGAVLFLNQGKGVPLWLDSFACTVTTIGRTRYKVSIPVDDDKERWIPSSQLTTYDPWSRNSSTKI